MTTHDLIKDLRQLLPLGPQIAMLVSEAADRLEDLQRERDEARAEAERLKQELHDTIESYKLNNLQPKNTRPEPSRLEIAAIMMAANLSRETHQWETVEETLWAIEQADALVAALKETK